MHVWTCLLPKTDWAGPAEGMCTTCLLTGSEDVSKWPVLHASDSISLFPCVKERKFYLNIHTSHYIKAFIYLFRPLASLAFVWKNNHTISNTEPEHKCKYLNCKKIQPCSIANIKYSANSLTLCLPVVSHSARCDRGSLGLPSGLQTPHPTLHPWAAKSG